MKDYEYELSSILSRYRQGLEEDWLTTLDTVDLMKKVFKQWALEMVGEDKRCHSCDGDDELSHDECCYFYENSIKEEIRQRIEEATKND